MIFGSLGMHYGARDQRTSRLVIMYKLFMPSNIFFILSNIFVYFFGIMQLIPSEWDLYMSQMQWIQKKLHIHGDNAELLSKLNSVFHRSMDCVVLVLCTKRCEMTLCL
eukprot:532011_1